MRQVFKIKWLILLYIFKISLEEILKMYQEDAYYTKVWEECSKGPYQSEISYLFHKIL